MRFLACKHFHGIISTQVCSENFPVSSPYCFRFPLVRQIYFTWIPLFVYICVVFNCKTKDISMIKCIFMTSWLLSNETFYFWILLLTCHFHIFGTSKNYETCSQSNFVLFDLKYSVCVQEIPLHNQSMWYVNLMCVANNCPSVHL